MAVILNNGSDEQTYLPDGTVLVQYDAPTIAGIAVVLQDCAHVITTRRGVDGTGKALGLFYDTTAGVSVPAHLLTNSDLDDSDLIRIASDWSVSCSEQVDGCNGATFTLRRQSDGKSIKFYGSIKIDGTGAVYPLVGTAGQVLSILVPQVPAQ